MHNTFVACAVVGAAVLVASPVFAHENDYRRFDQHARDHEEHGLFHDGASGAHARAHAQGFSSRAEHRGYHRAQRQMHGEFHRDHPGTRHDGYRLPPERSAYGYSPYSYGYAPYAYGYSPYSYAPGVTFSFGIGRGW